jgi:hypothetical protein
MLSIVWIVSVGFLGKNFPSKGAEKLTVFPRCLLSEFVRVLYLPSSVYTRIWSAEFQQSRKNFLALRVEDPLGVIRVSQWLTSVFQ